MNKQPDTFGGMSRQSVCRVLAPCAWERVREIDRAEMVHGVHWTMRGDLVYLPAGLELVLERLRETHPGDALALRAEIDAALAKCGAAASEPAAKPEPLAGAHAAPTEQWWQRL